MLNFLKASLKLLHTQPVCLWLYPDIEWFGCRWIHLIAAVLLCSVLLIRHKDWAYTRSEHTHCCTSSSVCVSASIVLCSLLHMLRHRWQKHVCSFLCVFQWKSLTWPLYHITYFKLFIFIISKVIHLFWSRLFICLVVILYSSSSCCF